MFLTEVNFAAITVAAIIQFIFGMFWYSPAVFGNAWMRGMGYRAEELSFGAGKLIVAFGISFLVAWVFSAFVHYFDVDNWEDGAWFGFYIWLGFGLPKFLSGLIWTKERFPAFLVNTVHSLITLLFYGVFLTTWM